MALMRSIYSPSRAGGAERFTLEPNPLAGRQPYGAPRRLAARTLDDALDRISASLAGEAPRRAARKAGDREAHVLAVDNELLQRRGRPAEQRRSADPEGLLDELEPRALPPERRRQLELPVTADPRRNRVQEEHRPRRAADLDLLGQLEREVPL